MNHTIQSDTTKYFVANKKTAQARKNNSVQLIKSASEILISRKIKPTIMQVTKLLDGRLGETTIKKYWRIINPKIKPNQKISNSVDENTSTGQLAKDFLELYIPEWNIKIFKPQYFEQVYNMNTQQANMFYQSQFLNKWLQTPIYWQ